MWQQGGHQAQGAAAVSQGSAASAKLDFAPSWDSSTAMVGDNPREDRWQLNKKPMERKISPGFPIGYAPEQLQGQAGLRC